MENSLVASVLGQMTDWAVYQNSQGICEFYNSAFARLLGFNDSASLIGTLTQTNEPPNFPIGLKHTLETAVSQAAAATFEQEIVDEAQVSRWFRVQTTPIFSEKNKLQGTLIVGHDITTRKRFENQIKEQLDFIESIYQGAKTPIFAVDVINCQTSEFRFASFNKVAEHTMGIEHDSLVGKSPNSVVAQRYRACCQSGQSVSYEETLQFDGRATRWLTTLNPLKNDAGQVYRLVGTTLEITRRHQAEEALKQKAQELTQALQALKRTQAQLIQTEKMSSLGQLVAGLAHEINNPISFIYGNIQCAEDYVKDVSELLALYRQTAASGSEAIAQKTADIDLDFALEDLGNLFASMYTGAERINEIVRSLRDFSCLDESGLKSVDINHSLQSALTMVRNRLRALNTRLAIDVSEEYQPLPLATGYPRELNQAFLNILLNAIDSLDGQFHTAGCDASAEVSTGHFQPKICIQTMLQDADTVVVKITDNGWGILPEARDRLFDPFFTTKPVGQGTGIGLAIAHQIIVHQHSGSLTYTSTCNLPSPNSNNTTFLIELPLRTI